MNPEQLLDLAQRAARGAGELLLEQFSGSPSGVSTKASPTDLVSDADRSADDFLQRFIGSERPDDGFITEESEGRPSDSGLTWVLDPLDGTVNYLFRIPWWAVSVAVEDREGVIAGVVYHPNLNELFYAVRGGGAFLNDAPIHVSDRDDISQALIATGFAYESDIRARQAEVVSRLLPIARDIRRSGSAALDLAGVACARFDAYYERRPERWDTAAGSLLVREAGGSYSDVPVRGDDKGVMVASNAKLHAELVKLVSTDP